MNTTQAYRHWSDGQQWLRVIDATGNEHDEPIAGWTEVHNLTNGVQTYRHDDGREYISI